MALGVVGSNPIIHPKRKQTLVYSRASVFLNTQLTSDGVWPNGKATDFDSVDAGSIPATPTMLSVHNASELWTLSFYMLLCI